MINIDIEIWASGEFGNDPIEPWTQDIIFERLQAAASKDLSSATKLGQDRDSAVAGAFGSIGYDYTEKGWESATQDTLLSLAYHLCRGDRALTGNQSSYHDFGSPEPKAALLILEQIVKRAGFDAFIEVQGRIHAQNEEQKDILSAFGPECKFLKGSFTFGGDTLKKAVKALGKYAHVEYWPVLVVEPDNFPNFSFRSTSLAAKAAAKQLEGYNNHDVEAFAAAYTDDVIVLNMDAGGVPICTGKEEMRSRYGALFSENPSLRCELVSRTIIDEHTVQDREKVTGHPSGKMIYVTATYEVDESGLIKKAYFSDRLLCHPEESL